MMNGNENVEDVMNKLFKEGEGPEQDFDVFDSIEQILNDDMALGIISNRIDGMDNEKIRTIATPVIHLLKSRGVEMFSAGNSERAEKFQAGIDTVSSYASIVREFFPILKMIYQYLSENKHSDAKLNDDEWDDMMFDENVNNDQQQKQNVDPNFINHPTEQRDYSGTGVSMQNNQNKHGALEQMLKNHMNKFGSSGMDKVLNEIEEMGNMSLEIDITNSSNNDSESKKFSDISMNDLVEKHMKKYGNEDMTKVVDEMKMANMDTSSIESQLNQNTDTKTPEPVINTDTRQGIFDDEEDSIPAEKNTSVISDPVPSKQDNSIIRKRMDDMPRPSGMPNPFERDDYLDGD